MTNQQVPEAPNYEHQRAIMEGERNASLDAYSRVLYLTQTESRIYEAGFTNGWNRLAALVDAQQPAPSAAVFGLRLVPVEPTDQMVQAAHHIDLSYMPGQEGADRAAIYRAMIAAAPQPAVQQWNDLIGKETHADADGLLVWRDEVDFAAPTPQADSAPVAAPADTVVLEAALRAIHQAIDLIGEPDTERLRTVRRVLRGAVVVAEDGTAPQADSQPAPVGNTGHDEADQIINRLMSSDPDFEDCMRAAMLIQREIKGPDGYPTWRDAAVAARAQADSVTAPAGGAMDGWKLAPEEPTLHMGWAYLDAARESEPLRTHTFNHAGYRAMLAVAPTPPAQAADSVLEDAERLDFLCSTDKVRMIECEQKGLWRVYQDEAPPEAAQHHWQAIASEWHTTPRAAIDAARKQGGAT